MTLSLKTGFPLLQTLKSCNRRFLSDKPRNRKWNLPPIQLKSRSDTTSNHISTSSTKKSINPQNIKPALKAASSSKTTAAGSTFKRDKSLPGTKKLESWAARKIALKQKYPEGWKPAKRLSPDAMEGIRILHRQV